MATMSPSTFNPLLSYVNVRLQQGVPIVDADLNELDDVRKFELRAFLKWFVGDGVPEGNDGFRIVGGLANDVVISAGPQLGDGGAAPVEAALRHVGRLIVDGVDVIIAKERKYSDQSLHESQPGAAALAATLEVPVLPRLTTPTEPATLVAYLDVWERLVTPDDEPDLVHVGVAVETCARMRREWVVRIDAEVPRPGQAGHLYYPLAALTRAAGEATIPEAAVVDRRERRLLVPPAHLLTDTLGVDPLAYRRGVDRPVVNLREAINALLVGHLPTTPGLDVSPATGADVFRRAAVLDTARGLVATWHSTRTGSRNQVVASRLDLTAPERGFSTAVALTSGNAGHLWPSAVALPDGDLLVAYQKGEIDDAGTAVHLKRAPWAELSSAAEVNVVVSSNAAEQTPHAVLSGDHVLFFVHRVPAANPTNSTWGFRRYRHNDATFLEGAPVRLSDAVQVRDLHAAAADGVVWVAYADGTNLNVLSVDPGTGSKTNTAAFPATGQLDVFVLAISATSAIVFFDGPTALQTVRFAGGSWQAPVTVPGTEAGDQAPAAVRGADGIVHLVHTQQLPRQPGDAVGRPRHAVVLRRQGAVAGEWSPQQRLTGLLGNHQRPYPVLVPGTGVWVLSTSGLGQGSDVAAKQVLTTI